MAMSKVQSLNCWVSMGIPKSSVPASFHWDFPTNPLPRSHTVSIRLSQHPYPHLYPHYILIIPIIPHYIPLYPIISHYIPLYPIISHYIPLYPIISHYIPLYHHVCWLTPLLPPWNPHVPTKITGELFAPAARGGLWTPRGRANMANGEIEWTWMAS